jgi:hypothetical protein
MGGGAIHEDLGREKEFVAGSNRSFGLVFSSMFALIGLLPLVGGGEPRIWSFVVAFLILIPALFLPSALRPLNVLWLRFGLLLSRVVSPIVLAIMFFGVITPMAFLVRRFGGNSLRLQRDSRSSSYWILRRPPGPAPDTLKNQF